MGLFKRVRDFWLGKGDQEEEEPESGQYDETRGANNQGRAKTEKSVVVPRQPVLQNAGYGAAGGVQGLDWFKESLKKDKDGDVANQFLSEQSDRTMQAHPNRRPLKVQNHGVEKANLKDASVFVHNGKVLIHNSKDGPSGG